MREASPSLAAAARVARARLCLGARFRAHGRSIDHGLDCVGVAAIAFGRTAPEGYALRGGSPARVAAGATALGLAAVTPGDARAGDLALIDVGSGQLHLGVLTGRGFVHADASLRRVVEAPGRPAGMIAAWTEGE